MTSEIPLQAVEELLLTVTRSAVPLLSETTAHILSAGGKRLRPRLVLLAYAAAGGTNIQEAVPLAAAVEIIHTATLVHDDINDHGTLRRGRETVNSRWGSTFALLTGDFMFTKTYEIMAPQPAELNRILARAATQLVEGETLQIQAARQGALDRDTYYEIIAKKTAALFVACTELGATAAGAPAPWVEALSTYAFNLGLAFQIVDDILDLVGDAQTLGKNAGIDLAQGRGLGAVRDDGNAPVSQSTAAVQITPDTAGGPFKESLLAGNSLEAAIELGRAKAQELIDRALTSLDILPPSPALEELRSLARQVISRDH
ncbi:MAG: octaprenyl-diphosphate synthase [Anaerolineae bacterium]|nr:MAG: octaprenyl-diphosphate synthase [Anaerolineae bacterium]